MQYSLRKLTFAIAVFYTALFLFDARGIYHWTTKLPLSPENRILRAVAEQHWKNTSEWGLEEPKFTLERLFLDFQDAHPLLYPKKYPDFVAQRHARAERKRLMVVDRSVREFADALAANRRLIRIRERVKNQTKPDPTQRPNILLVGDSIMAGIGPVIKREAFHRLNGRASVRARVATGLARPDIFDWQRELEGLLAEDSYDSVVLMMGTNDSQDLVEDGDILIYGTNEWVKAYNQRVSQLMEIACQGSERVIWIGLPPMRNPSFNRKITRINSWAKRQAKHHPCVTYMALNHIIGDENGKFASYLKVHDEVEKIRMVDGIHITSHGGQLISEHLLPMLSRQSDVSTLSH